MKILLIHNYYKYFGGEDQVFLNEKKLLEENKDNHKVFSFTVSNEEISNYSLSKKILFFPNAIKNHRVLNDLSDLINTEKPDVAHIHNLYPLLSVGIYKFLYKNNIPVVQSFHDHRLAMLCPQGNSYSNGKICNLCYDGAFQNCIIKKCVKSSFILSGHYTILLILARWFGAKKYITKGIYFNNYMYNNLKRIGFPIKKLVQKPHFIAENLGKPTYKYDKYFVFIGAISLHKGIKTLINAYKQITTNYKLLIIGEGEYSEELKKNISNYKNIEYLGFISGKKRLDIIKDAYCVISPSEVAETFGMTVLESLACGVPVIASKVGGFPDLVIDEHTGLLFEARNVLQLKNSIIKMLESPTLVKKMGKNARAHYEKNYQKKENYKLLINIYKSAIDDFPKENK